MIRSRGFVLLAIVAALTTASALAQDRRLPSGVGEMKLSFAPTVQRTAPAVVNVYAAKVVANRNPLFEDPMFRRFFGGPGLQREQVQRSLGSGVIVDASGFVVTNNHVVEGASEVKIALSDRREFEADIVLKDPRTDLAVLRIKHREAFPFLEFANSDELQVGDLVLAIGNPFSVGQTVTHGIVSALARTQVGITDYQFFIQTDAAINPGNSGGALVDVNGKLVGINTAIYSRSGGSQGIGFAIPANMVRVVVASAREGGSTVRRPWLGAKLQALSPDLAETFNLKRPAGALVTHVIAGSPAARAGLKLGDLISAIDGQTIEDPETFGFRFATRALGGNAVVTVMRDGKEARMNLPLEPAPENPPREPVKIRARSPFAGATMITLSPAVAEEMRIDNVTSGVVVAEVEEGTTAEAIGFQPGDVVLEVNGERVTRSRELDRLAQNPQRAWRVQINRGGKTFSRVIGG